MHISSRERNLPQYERVEGISNAFRWLGFCHLSLLGEGKFSQVYAITFDYYDRIENEKIPLR